MGTYAWTYFAERADSGGSLHLRCKDDTVLAGRLTVVDIDVPGGDSNTPHITVRLDDGFYRAP